MSIEGIEANVTQRRVADEVIDLADTLAAELGSCPHFWRVIAEHVAKQLREEIRRTDETNVDE
jgi:hypothetical protein